MNNQFVSIMIYIGRFLRGVAAGPEQDRSAAINRGFGGPDAPAERFKPQGRLGEYVDSNHRAALHTLD